MNLWLKSIILWLALCFLGFGCLSAFHRTEVDRFEGASATYQGAGRDTSYSTTQPTSGPAEATTQVRQREPALGEVFRLHIHGKVFEGMKMTDGKVHILQEATP